MVGNAGQYVAQVALGVETNQLRRADQAVDRGGAFAACIRTRKEVVLSFMKAFP